ncbi:MAG: aldehyde dehydrogenase family protein [Planctomycetota bacterium]|nr:aldehyde dehydrogenase family protein [Planctomycetota bacterium]
MSSGIDPDLRALQDVRDMVARAKRACEAIHHYDQRQADALCAAMAKAGAAAAYDLARLAVEETGIGRVHYKVLKNLVGSEGAWASIQNEKTVGVISRDERTGVVEVATASGVIAGIVPTTNPTSTALFKSIISVKGKNAIVISPHPRARRCIAESAEVLRRAIERAGGPPDLVLSLPNPTIESTGALMKHKDVALILATGGTALVQAAYSSGKPAYGVGPGNVPCYIDRSADIAWAAQAITASQSFDNATLCCSEQGLILDAPIANQLIAELVKRGAYLCNEDETKKLAKFCNVRGHMNPDVVGIDPWRVAELSGFAVPKTTTILLAWQGGIGKDWPLSIEILCPVLSLHKVDGWKEGCQACMDMLAFDGLGHTLGIHAKDERVLEAFFLEKPANRIIVNGPCSQGAVGYSTNLVPSMSLGCGPQAGNITSDNITAKHLINIKRAAFVRRDWAQIEQRDHERVAALTKDGMPRGSGLRGDPALSSSVPLASSSALTPDAGSNWRGNPASSERATPTTSETATPWKSKVAPAQKSTPPVSGFAAGSGVTSTLPTFMSPSTIQPAPKPLAPTAPKTTSPYAGGALSSIEIQTLMSHAGSGCPLGPCKGCPHHEVTTGSCRA